VTARPAQKTALSFYVDDTNPHLGGAKAFQTFLDFVSGEGIAGESSVILGYDWDKYGLLSQPRSEEQRAYIEQLHRAFECGIESNMELMTHSGLYDFDAGCVPDGAQHEGLWLYEPGISLEEYESYFRHIIQEGERIGVRFTGVTWPGCGCEACQRRAQELLEAGPLDVNPSVWKALLKLAKEGKFRGHTVPCFILAEPVERPLKMTAGDGSYGVYDLYPNADDYFGSWVNDRAQVDADYYITADGESGRIVEKVRAGAPYCLFCSHWQGLNPTNGVGWEAFTQVVARVKKHLEHKVVWMRPSQLPEHVHASAAARRADSGDTALDS
jgi:hypothetical protein